MHVQIVTFNLQGISESEYIDVAHQVANRFSAMPGLLAKLWLEHPQSNTYGGIYFWDDEESMQRFLRSDLFEGTNPEFTNVVSEDFGILERLTRATQPVLEILEEAAGRYQPAPRAVKASAPAAKAVKGGRKQVPAKSTAAKSTAAKRTAVKKVPAKSPAVKKVVAKKLPAKKAGTRSTPPGRKG